MNVLEQYTILEFINIDQGQANVPYGTQLHCTGFIEEDSNQNCKKCAVLWRDKVIDIYL